MLTETQALRVELEDAQREAKIDRLTGVGTVLALDSVLGECFRTGAPFELVLFDVAKFKSANEVEGYPWANAFLARCGTVLRQHRGDGYAFRQGGDEFMIILPGSTRHAAELVRDRVEQAVGFSELSDGTVIFLAGGVSSWDGKRAFSAVVDEGQERMNERKLLLGDCPRC